MAKDKTQKSKFLSKYGGDYIAAGQYLAEKMCEKMAALDKKTLPYRFWELADWKKTYILQVTHANKLLKKYSVSVIIAALNDKDAYRVRSLGALYILEKILEKYKREESFIEKQAARQQAATPDDSPTNIDNDKPRESFVMKKKNLLRELD